MSQYSPECQEEADYWQGEPPQEEEPDEQCFCQSYVDDNGELKDCTCGRCADLLTKKRKVEV